MLSRVANNISWMHRYRERAECLARLIEVSFMLNIDQSEKQWKPLLQTTSEMEIFEKHYKEITEKNVINFLTFDTRNPGSIQTCISKARENARSVREIISSDMWQEINTLYLYTKASDYKSANLHTFYTRVKRQSQLFTGLSDSTISHNLAWHFGRLAYLLERADMTSRILDIKYFMLLPSIQQVGSPLDNIQWNALLNSTSALEMYRQKWQQIKHLNVVEFLILDRDFPRSIYSCLNKVKNSLFTIKENSGNPLSSEPYEIIQTTLEKLEGHNGQSIVNYGLHEYLDEIQQGIIQVNDSIAKTYLGVKKSKSLSLL